MLHKSIGSAMVEAQKNHTTENHFHVYRENFNLYGHIFTAINGKTLERIKIVDALHRGFKQ